MPSPTQHRSPFAGGTVFAFALRDQGRLVRLDEQAITASEYPDGKGDVMVNVSIYLGDAGLFCGSIVVRTAPTDPADSGVLRLDGPDVPIASQMWRALPVGALIDETIERVKWTAESMARYIDDEHNDLVAAAAVSRVKPGPRPSLTPELLAQVVAPAYITGGRKPVQSVRAALQRSGYLGSAADGSVTIDQARKAVVQARRLGILPPASRRSKGEHSP